MSVPLLVHLHARAALRIYSTSAASCHNTFLAAARISQTSNIRPLFVRCFNTRASALSQRVPPIRPAQLSIRQFTKNTVWNATHRDWRVPAGGQRPPSGKSRFSWIDNLPQPIIFWGILAINAGVYVMWYYAESAVRTLHDPTSYKWMYKNFTASLANLRSGRIWTILTSCFSQMDTKHLLFNGFTYFFFARTVLSMLGNRQFLILYLGGGIMSSLTSIVWNNFVMHHAVSSLGASGAIYAILSYYACRLPYSTIMVFGIIPFPAWAFIPGVLLFDGYEMMASHKRSDTDAAGHVGGILTGALYYFFRLASIRF